MAFFPISPVPQSGGNFLNSMHMYMFAWCALTPTKVMIAYCQDNPIKLYVQIVNFNGSNPPSMGPVTYIGDLILAATINTVVKLDAFDASNVALLWSVNSTSSTYNVSVLNVDASDNITWNTPASFASGIGGYFTTNTAIKCLSTTNATITAYDGRYWSPRQVTRSIVSNTLTIGGPAFQDIQQPNFWASPRKLPTTGVVYVTSLSNQVSSNLSFTNVNSAIVGSPLSGTGAPFVVNVVSNSLIHTLRSTAGVIYARPATINITTGTSTGSWVTAEQNYSIAGWPAGTVLDVIPIDNEYFMLMQASTLFGLPTAFTVATYSFIIGRFTTVNNTYTFSPVSYIAPTQGIPMWGMRHLHLVNPNTVACFCIQGTDTNRVLGVKLLYL